MTGQSEKIDGLVKALAKAQGAFPDIEPDGQGQVGGGFNRDTGEQRAGRKYKYATLANVIKKVRPTLAENGLAVSQTTEPGERGYVRVVTTLFHESGQWTQGALEMPLVNVTPQGYGSAMTYARRYAYCAILGIASEDDDDGHEATMRGDETETAAPPRQQRTRIAPKPGVPASPTPPGQPAAAAAPEQPKAETGTAGKTPLDMVLSSYQGAEWAWFSEQAAKAGHPTITSVNQALNTRSLKATHGTMTGREVLKLLSGGGDEPPETVADKKAAAVSDEVDRVAAEVTHAKAA